MTSTEQPGKTPAEKGDASGTPNATQGGTRGAANSMGRHSKEADHSPGSPAEVHKAKGTEKLD
jgi:hypothetical protein